MDPHAEIFPCFGQPSLFIGKLSILSISKTDRQNKINRCPDV